MKNTNYVAIGAIIAVVLVIGMVAGLLISGAAVTNFKYNLPKESISTSKNLDLSKAASSIKTIQTIESKEEPTQSAPAQQPAAAAQNRLACSLTDINTGATGHDACGSDGQCVAVFGTTTVTKYRSGCSGDIAYTDTYQITYACSNQALSLQTSCTPGPGYGTDATTGLNQFKAVCCSMY